MKNQSEENQRTMPPYTGDSSIVQQLNMKLAKEAVQEFIEIYQSEFGEELSYEDAAFLGVELLNFYSLIKEKSND